MFDILSRLDASVALALATLLASAGIALAGLLRQAVSRRRSS